MLVYEDANNCWRIRRVLEEGCFFPPFLKEPYFEKADSFAILLNPGNFASETNTVSSHIWRRKDNFRKPSAKQLQKTEKRSKNLWECTYILHQNPLMFVRALLLLVCWLPCCLFCCFLKTRINVTFTILGEPSAPTVLLPYIQAPYS